MHTHYDLDRLQRLHVPNDARHRPEHAELLARPHRGARRRRRVQAAIARAVLAQVVHAQLPLELLRGAAHERLPERDGGVGEQVPRGHVVGAVEEDVVGLEEGERVGSGEGGGVDVEGEVGVDAGVGVVGIRKENGER
jgi:hypothetical protein